MCKLYQKNLNYASILHMSPEKILGIDYGTKRIGFAVSDENRTISFPKVILKNTPNVFSEIRAFLKKENIGEIVVGDSLNLSGELNKISKEIDNFVFALEKEFRLPVHKQKEFLTSVEARRLKDIMENKKNTEAHSRTKKEKSEKVDAVAAALILQRYLDKINNKVSGVKGS